MVSLRMPAKSPSGNGEGICRASWPGLMKMSWASALMARNRPRVTITTLSGLWPDSTGRISSRSISAPAITENTTESRMAGTMLSPWSVSHQVTKVLNRAISPWAKLSRPVVR